MKSLHAANPALLYFQIRLCIRLLIKIFHRRLAAFDDLHWTALAMYRQDETERRFLAVSLVLAAIPFDEYRWTGRLGGFDVVVFSCPPRPCIPPLQRERKTKSTLRKDNLCHYWL